MSQQMVKGPLQNLGDLFGAIRSGVVADGLSSLRDIRNHDFNALAIDGPKFLTDLGLTPDAANARQIIADLQNKDMVALISDSLKELVQLLDEFAAPAPAPSKESAIMLMASAGPGGRVHPLVVLIGRHDTAVAAQARQPGLGYFTAYGAARKVVTAEAMAQGLMKAGGTPDALAFGTAEAAAGKVMAMFDGHIIEMFQAWQAANPQLWQAIRSFLLALLPLLIAL